MIQFTAEEIGSIKAMMDAVMVPAKNANEVAEIYNKLNTELSRLEEAQKKTDTQQKVETPEEKPREQQAQ